MQVKKIVSLMVSLLMIMGFVVAFPVFAVQNNETAKNNSSIPSISVTMGKITAIDGTTITMTSEKRSEPDKNKKTTLVAITYTVDASKAKVTGNGSDKTISDLKVSDNILVQGTVSGKTITAKMINYNAVNAVGNGQPVVVGNVTVISGTTITINNPSNVTYTVDASKAKFVLAGIKDATISNVAVGDRLIIQGATNGNSITASSIINQKIKTENKGKQGFFGSMMGNIGGFFKHLFGF